MTALGLLSAAVTAALPARALVTPDPTSVTIAGSLQSELGCPGDWQPDCAATHLAYDAADGVWQGTFAVPAGSWEYKAALNGAWDENYGQNATRRRQHRAEPGRRRDGQVLLRPRHALDHRATAMPSSRVPGSFQSELGCPGDWQPDCLRWWLQDPDGDGIYAFTTRSLPAGDYEAKVAHDESWDENYGAGAVPDGPNIAFTVPTRQRPGHVQL